MACPNTSSDLQITNVAINNPLCISGIKAANHIVTFTVTFLLILAAVISFTMLIWGAIQYITSGGDRGGVSKARAKIIYSIIGVIVSFLSFFAWQILAHIFGFNTLQL